VIGEFLPKQLDEGAVIAAAKSAIASTGATSIKDMGKVVNALKAAHAGEMDFAKASAIVKGLLFRLGAAKVSASLKRRRVERLGAIPSTLLPLCT